MSHPVALLDFFVAIPTEKKKPKFPGFTVPKARPRVSNGRAYLPERYSAWQTAADDWLRRNVQIPTVPYVNAGVCILFVDSVAGNSDLDNAIGSWLDAIVKAGIIDGDNVSRLPFIFSRFTSASLVNGIKGTRVIITETFPGCPFNLGLSLPPVEPVVEIPKKTRMAKVKVSV